MAFVLAAESWAFAEFPENHPKQNTVPIRTTANLWPALARRYLLKGDIYSPTTKNLLNFAINST